MTHADLSPQPQRARPRGFSLIEVMVTAAIFLILSAGVCSFLAMMLRDSSHETRLAAADEVGQAVLKQLLTTPPGAGSLHTIALTFIFDEQGVPVAGASGLLINVPGLTPAARAALTRSSRPRRGFTVWTQPSNLVLDATLAAAQGAPTTWTELAVHVEWTEEDGAAGALLIKGFRR